VSNLRGQSALQITPIASSKLVRAQTIKSKPSTFYALAREWTTKSKLHQTILMLSRKKKKRTHRSQQRKMTKFVVDNQEKSFQPKTPFPQRLQQTRKKNHCKRILKVFKNVQINIPFLDAINHIPSYAKFPKDLPTVKRKSFVPREAAFATQVFCLIQQPIAPKYEVPGSPTISVRIGDQVMDQCLLDLG